MDKKKVFEIELNLIKDVERRSFAEKAIELLPDYFFEIPASSTSKYHPKFALGEGGLVRHTKAAVKIAVELFNLDWWKFEKKERELIVIALILHDGFKSGIEKGEYTIAEHPIIASDFFKSNKELNQLIDIESLNFICDCISHHMGQFVYHPKTKEKVLEEPRNKFEKFVFLCDYFASRKFIEIDFEK